jgi:hypothetical protein
MQHNPEEPKMTYPAISNIVILGAIAIGVLAYAWRNFVANHPVEEYEILRHLR